MMCRWMLLGLLLACGLSTSLQAAAPSPTNSPASRDRDHRNNLSALDGDATRHRPTPPGFTKAGLKPNDAPRSTWAISRDREFARPGECLASSDAAAPTMLLPGEFEKQSAIVLGCGQLASFAPETLAEVVAAASKQAPVIALAPDAQCRQDVLRALHKKKLAADAVQFVAVRHDTMWARDYGPLLVRQADGSPALVDANYAESKRFQDDAVPKVLGHRFGLPVFNAPLCLEGGNLLSNGCGLCLTTRKVLEANLNKGVSETEVRNVLREYYGAEQSVFLEPLAGEGTGHVDMFACFVSADTVVVGQYDAASDPKNAAVLDRNAATLAGLRTSAGPIKVERVPMPTNADGVFRSYTNVVFANGVLLMPSYGDHDSGRDAALATYQRLLPNREVQTIDASAIIAMGGALHCLSLNLTAIESPKLVDSPAELSDARTARVLPARRPRRGR